MTDYKKKFEKLVKADFESVSETIDTEIARVEETAEKIFPFGISYLDAALGGVQKRDLIVIGAKSGKGKSEMALNIALNGASLGKKIYYFALEYEDGEVSKRILFRRLSAMYHEEHGQSPPNISFGAFVRGALRPFFAPYYERATEEIKAQLENLNVFYRRESDFTLEVFLDKMAKIRGDADLIVIDHLNYFDVGDDDMKGVSKIMKAIRDRTTATDIPIILVSHVRKPDIRDKRIVPGIETLHGSSDIYKMATKVVILEPDYEKSIVEPWRLATFLHTAKMRFDGSVDRYIGRVYFDLKKSKYDESFEILRLIKGNTSLEEVTTGKMPWWAKTESTDPYMF